MQNWKMLKTATGLLVYFSHEARATEYLFKLPRVSVAVLSIPTAAYYAYIKKSLHTRVISQTSILIAELQAAQPPAEHPG